MHKSPLEVKHLPLGPALASIGSDNDIARAAAGILSPRRIFFTFFIMIIFCVVHQIKHTSQNHVYSHLTYNSVVID